MTNLFDELVSRFDGVEIKLDDPGKEADTIEANLKSTTGLVKPMLMTRIIHVQENAVMAAVKAHNEIERRDIAGAVFDFTAWLTTRDMSLTVGRSHACAGELADLVAEWAQERGLSIEDARILHWQNGIIEKPGELAQMVDPKAPATSNGSYVGGSKADE